MKNRILILFIYIIVAIIVFSSCKPYAYPGDYPELFTVALHSLLGAEGFLLSEVKFSPKIEILEEDEYGRVLFAYSEGGILNLIIIQKSDSKYSYYYPDYNFISSLLPPDGFFNDQVFNHTLLNAFPEEAKQSLKEKNDWEKELDESKFIKAEIVRRKTEPDIKIKELDFEILFKKIARDTDYKGKDALFRNSVYCTSDDYGRMLYYGYGIGKDIYDNGVYPDTPRRYFQLALIFNPDGSYNENICILELTDLLSYQDDLKAFKDKNGWNTGVI
jgi:hypothetical protein